MVATDNASYSDMVFGLFKILGYNSSTRFRDLDDPRFWRATMPGVETGTYGAAHTASTPAAGALRPLRDPDASALDEDDDGLE